MNEIEICMHDKIALGENLRPIILKAILEIYKEGSQRISDQTVKEKCVEINSLIPWNG